MKTLPKQDVQKILDAVRAVTPPNSRLSFRYDGFLHEIDICCDGADLLFCYFCGLKPGHKGACHSINKDIDFQPIDRIA